MRYAKERPHKDRSTTVCTCTMQGTSNLLYPHLSEGDCLCKPLFNSANFYIWAHRLHFGKCDKYFARYAQLNYRKLVKNAGKTTKVQLCCRYEGEDRRSSCQRGVRAQNDSYSSIPENGQLSVRCKTHLMASSFCLGQGGMSPVLLVNMVSVVMFRHQ